MVKIILENMKGAELSNKPHQGLSALHYAVILARHSTLEHSRELIRSLLEYGLNTNSGTENGSTPLHLIAEAGIQGDSYSYGGGQATRDNVTILEMLVDKGGNPSLPQLDGNIPLHLFSMLDSNSSFPPARCDRLAYLINPAPELNEKNRAGFTALYLLCITFSAYNHYHQLTLIAKEIIGTFLQHGASAVMKDPTKGPTIRYVSRVSTDLATVTFSFSKAFLMPPRQKNPQKLGITAFSP
jgi:hypothetical protein